MTELEAAIQGVSRVVKVSKNVFVGIDPGLQDGAWGFLSQDGVACYAGLIPLTVTKNGKTKGGKAKYVRDYNFQAIKEVLSLLPTQTTFATVEKPMVIRGMPAAAGKAVMNTPLTAFRTAWGGAPWPAVFTFLGIRYCMVASSSWKRKVDICKLEKREVLNIAAKRWPLAFPKFRVKDHNLAEALLLADVGRVHGDYSAKKRKA